MASFEGWSCIASQPQRRILLVSPRPGEGILSSFIAPGVRVLAKDLEGIISGFRLPAKDPETINVVRSCDTFRAILLPELGHLR